jgi:hypothetical protein
VSATAAAVGPAPTTAVESTAAAESTTTVESAATTATVEPATGANCGMHPTTSEAASPAGIAGATASEAVTTASVAYATTTVAISAATISVAGPAIVSTTTISIAASPITVIPGAGADKEPTNKPARAVKAIRRTGVWVIVVIAPRTNRGGVAISVIPVPAIASSNPNADTHLSVGRGNHERCRNQ